jgi:small ligand-binding sensory domain FIST
VAGGAASVRGDAPRTFQLSGGELSEGAVSGVRLGGKFVHHVAISQGHRPLGEPVRITRAHENLIFEVDGRPALDALRERAGDDFFDEPGSALDKLSIGFLPDPQSPRLSPGEFLVRNLVAIDPDTGVLGVADVVEEGEHVVFCVREPDAARQDLARLLALVSAERPARDFRFGLYFDCLARGRALYGKEGVDAAVIARSLPGVPVLGFFCNAEIAPLRGANYLFTYTGVLVLVAE